MFKGGPLWQAGQDTDTPSFLAAIFEDDYRQVARGRSYWWVPGNDQRGRYCMQETGCRTLFSIRVCFGLWQTDGYRLRRVRPLPQVNDFG